MAAPFPFPLPLNAYAGLGNGFSEIPGGLNYTRQPVTMEMTSDGVTVSNLNTLEWCIAGNDWGPVSSVMLYDAPTGGNLLFTLLLSGDPIPYNWANYSVGLYSPTSPPPMIVHQYDRVRISASSMTAVTAPLVATGYGMYGFGTNAYGTAPLVEGSAAAILLTFGAISLCSPGTWAPGPCACDCVA